MSKFYIFIAGLMYVRLQKATVAEESIAVCQIISNSRQWSIQSQYIPVCLAVEESVEWLVCDYKVYLACSELY